MNGKREKVLTTMDGWNNIFFYNADVWWIHIGNQVSKHGKRDDNEEIVIQTICLDELYKMNEYSLRKTSYATEQIDITYYCSVSALLHDCSIRHLLRF